MTLDQTPGKPAFNGSPANRRRPAGRKVLLWTLLPLLLLLAVVSVLIVRGVERKRLQAIDSSAKSEVILPVRVTAVTAKDIPRFIQHSGIIKAWQQANILSEVAGKVKMISAKTGDYLEPGSQILKLDDEMLTYIVEQARGNVLQLEANYEISLREFKRKSSLFKNKVISDFEFDIAKAKEKADRAQLESAKVSLKIARRDLRETSIVSPIRGILAERSVDIGTNVAMGVRVATVVDIEQVKIKVGISEKDISEIREGLPVEILTDAIPGKTYVGSVYSVGTKADDLTLTFPVEIVVVNNQAPILKPGMVSRVSIKTGLYRNAIVLPQEAVITNDGQQFVWTISDGRAHQVTVVTGAVVGSDILIQDGLSPGMQVVVTGQGTLFEGSPVQIIDKEQL